MIDPSIYEDEIITALKAAVLGLKAIEPLAAATVDLDSIDSVQHTAPGAYIAASSSDTIFQSNNNLAIIESFTIEIFVTTVALTAKADARRKFFPLRTGIVHAVLSMPMTRGDNYKYKGYDLMAWGEGVAIHKMTFILKTQSQGRII